VSNKHTEAPPSDPLWWHNQSRRAHPVKCDCAGCSGARKARGHDKNTKEKAT
jgi:hypothetical protein